MKCSELRKLNRKTERVLSFGGVDLLEKPLLVNLIVAVAISTDFAVFFSSLSSVYDLTNALITSLCSATLIDTIPLVTARCIRDLRSERRTPLEKKWSATIMVLSIAAFLAFFIFSFVVRFNNGASLFSLEVVDGDGPVELTLNDLSAAQKSMLLFTCALPLFTSLGVFLVGLFVDNRAKRRELLRIQRTALMEKRTQLMLQKLELETMLASDSNGQGGALLEDMKSYMASISTAMGIYYRTALAENLRTPDDLSHLSRSSSQLLEMKKQLIHLASFSDLQDAAGNEH